MSNTPRVSVIISTYNRAAFLGEAIESVLAQTYGDYELIVADDGSTDDTAERVTAFGDEVRYLQLNHSGRPSVVRNRALEIARGDLVAFLDDDDRWLPEKLQRQVTLFAEGSAPGFVYTDFRFLNAGALSQPVLTPAQKRSGAIFDDLLRDCFIHPSTMIVRRSLLDTTGGFDETFASAEDYDLWLRLAHTAPAGFVDTCLTLVRRHPAGISYHREEETSRNVIRTLEQTRDHLPLSRRQRLRLRRALARRYTHLGRYLQESGEGPGARRQFLTALRLNPFLARAWLELAGSFRPSAHE